MYCSILDIKNLLPENVTLGNDNIGTPNPARPNQSNRDKLTIQKVVYYINYAQQQIDSRLSPFYAVPLRRIKTFEAEPLNNVSSGENVKIRIYDASVFSKYMTVRIQNNSENELAEVSEIPNSNTIVLDSLTYSYDVSESLVSIVKYPDPIPVTTARLAVSFAFDQLFSAEQEPDISQYGREQRQLAQNAIDAILSGTTFLIGQQLVGRRFLRGTLYDGFGSPTNDFQFGREGMGG